MTQSRAVSLFEASSSVVAGFLLSLAMQAVLFPAVGLQTTLTQNLKLAVGFAALSLVRSAALRRVFNRMRG